MPENPLGTLTGSSFSEYTALKLDNLLFEVPARVTKPWKKIQINVTSFKVRLVVVYLSLVDLDL